MNLYSLTIAVIFSMLVMMAESVIAGECNLEDHYEGHIVEGSMWNLDALDRLGDLINLKKHCSLSRQNEKRVLNVLLTESICSNVFGINQSIVKNLSNIDLENPYFDYIKILKNTSPKEFTRACTIVDSITWPKDDFLPLLFSKSSYIPPENKPSFENFWIGFNNTRKLVTRN